MLHAAAARRRHSQEEAQHQTLQGPQTAAAAAAAGGGGGGGEASSCSPLAPQVVPFSQKSGVLEWCSGTVPLGHFLVDPDQGAHRRFRPQDWSSLSCRRKMMVGRSLSAALLPCSSPLLLLRLLPALTRSSRPTARCAATSGPSSGSSAWSASWTRRCGWRSGWPTPAAWPPPP